MSKNTSKQLSNFIQSDNMKELSVRLLTGIGLIALILVGTLININTFFVVFGIINLMCLVEYVSITMHEDTTNDKLQTVRKIISVLIGLFPFVWMILYFQDPAFATQPKVWVSYLAFFLSYIVFEFLTNDNYPLKNTPHVLFGTIYIGLAFSLLIYLTYFNHTFFDIPIDESPRFILGIALLIYMYDSGAYVTGRLFGKHLLFPKASPKKTWEGAIGGGVLTIVMAYLYTLFFFKDALHWYDWIAIAGIISIFGVFGDLIESKLKRKYKLKDSGDVLRFSLLPGHGGFLDRYDGFILIIPFIAFYFIWMYL